MTLHVRRAVRDDLSIVAAIERDAFGDPWSEAMLRAHVGGDPDTFLVADEGDTIVGFAIARTVAGEAELLDIAVAASARRRGVGAALLDAVVARCIAAGARTMTLEVRASNAAARTLYARHGFVRVGVRRRYYREPDEDGLLLRAALPVGTVHAAVPR